MHTAEINVPVETCFRFVDTPEHVPSWLFGISEFVPVGEQERGLGTIVAISAKIGPMALRGRGKVCEYVENEVIAVKAELGSLAAVISWLFRRTSSGGTEITADVAYITAPGLVGRAVARIAEKAIPPAIERSELSLRTQLLATSSDEPC
jgi:hypothetical protein